jgi:3-hydroxyacyl-[acyl-carrier-protein] dehydratase
MAMDIHQIMKMLPHRYPFLLIDRVVELIPEEKIIALKNVTCNEPFFWGHFPEKPIMPGVLIVEGMVQAGGLLAFAAQSDDLHGKPVYFMAMDRVKFRRPVVPGDQLFFSVTFLKRSSWAVKFYGLATVDEKAVCEAELTATWEKQGRTDGLKT